MGLEWSWGIEPGYMGTPTALLHTELVGNQEYLPGSAGVAELCWVVAGQVENQGQGGPGSGSDNLADTAVDEGSLSRPPVVFCSCSLGGLVVP